MKDRKAIKTERTKMKIERKIERKQKKEGRTDRKTVSFI